MILEAFAEEISIVSSAERGSALLTTAFARLPSKLQDSFLKNSRQTRVSGHECTSRDATSGAFRGTLVA